MKSIETAQFGNGATPDVEKTIEGERRRAAERSWTRERTLPTNDVLLDTTLTWMARLPKHVRPMVLAARYPRIANNIADLWRRVARCEDYLDGLVVDRRGTRAGFPIEVARELNDLRGFYAELHPDQRTGWDRTGSTI